MARAKDEPLYTVECAHEAVILRAYCESRWPIGPETHNQFSVTGENYLELCQTMVADSAEDARLEAQAHFDRYANGRSGTLYWRIVPEIALTPKREKYGYYMRLLISDKPRKD